MPKPLLPLFLLLLINQAYSQGYNPAGARSASLSGSSLCLTDVWAFHHNPGATASLKNFSAGAYYDSRFLTKELQNQAIALSLPLKKGVISAGGQFNGYEQFRNTRTGLGYALELGEKFSAGVQMNLQQLRLGSNYGSATTATVEAGVLATITDKWKFGASAMNIARQRIEKRGNDRYTSVLRMGTSYEPSKKVLVTAEVQKEVIHPVSFKAGIEYKPSESFVIRTGAQSGPAGFAFGIGYRKKGFFIDTGTNYHQILGFTPHFGLTYQLPVHAQN